MSKFKVGDRVRVVDPGRENVKVYTGTYKNELKKKVGKVFTIWRVVQYQVGTYFLEGASYVYEDSMLEPAIPPKKVKLKDLGL